MRQPRSRYGGQPAERLHDQAHELAERLFEEPRRKDETTAWNALQALRALHDQLTEQVFNCFNLASPDNLSGSRPDPLSPTLPRKGW
ncbi:MAG: hypothetical protein EOM92_02450 [Gammaproteobacteria bacterium]|nr:hypothetical protein [Gammaproteobacteria bacterium]